MTVPFITEHDPAYGKVVEVTPLIRRVTAENPGRFTGLGTGTYVVGRGQVAIIDPGPDIGDHVEALLAAVAGEEVSHIVVTHTHRDHSPASRPLQAATGAAVYGFGPHPASPLPRGPHAHDDAADPHGTAGKGATGEEEPGDLDFVPDVEVVHGDVIAGGTWTLEAVHTPGHISNHLCYGLTEERALFSGDHVMGWSTTIIPPPDGHMGDYVASLRLLLGRDDLVYYPTHGPPVTEPKLFATALLSHRLDRERQIVGELARGERTIATIVEVLYADVRPELHEAAGRSVLAHLVDLVAEDQVSCDGEPSIGSTFRLTRQRPTRVAGSRH